MDPYLSYATLFSIANKSKSHLFAAPNQAIAKPSSVQAIDNSSGHAKPSSSYAAVFGANADSFVNPSVLNKHSQQCLLTNGGLF